MQRLYKFAQTRRAGAKIRVVGVEHLLIGAFLLLPVAAAAHGKPWTLNCLVELNDARLRVEIFLSFEALERYVSVPRRDPDLLTKGEADAMMAELAQRFGRLNRVTIDGIEVRPVLADFRIAAPGAKPGGPTPVLNSCTKLLA